MRSSFNEAAGIPRGRLVTAESPTLHGLASMRPRVFPAEDSATSFVSGTPTTSFNEAAGIPRGRQPAASRLSSR